MLEKTNNKEAGIYERRKLLHEALRCRYRPSGTGGTKVRRPRFLRVPSVRVPRAELLPDQRRHSPVRVVVGEPVVVQPDLATVAAEVDVRHALPRAPAGDVDLVAGSPDVGHVLTVHGFDPLGVEHGSGEDARVRRLLGVADVAGLLVAVAAEVDDLPAQPRLVLDPLEQAKPLGTGLVVAVPAPLRVLLARRDLPQLVERPLDVLATLLLVVEVGDEGDDDQLVLGPLRDAALRLEEAGVDEAPASLEVQLAHARDLRLRLHEETVDEGEGGLRLQRVDDDLGESGVLPDLLRHLCREAGLRELAHEIRNLAETEREQVRHVATPILSIAVGTSQPRTFADVSFPLIENGMLRPISWPHYDVFNFFDLKRTPKDITF